MPKSNIIVLGFACHMLIFGRSYYQLAYNTCAMCCAGVCAVRAC